MYSVGKGVKQPEREADSLPRFIAEIKRTFTPQYALLPSILNLHSCMKDKNGLA